MRVLKPYGFKAQTVEWLRNKRSVWTSAEPDWSKPFSYLPRRDSIFIRRTKAGFLLLCVHDTGSATSLEYTQWLSQRASGPMPFVIKIVLNGKFGRRIFWRHI